MSPLLPRVPYTLIGIAINPGPTTLSQLICVSFARGTRIARANGAQCAIETLHPGDLILTRDHGAQPIRWIGRAAVRAVGPLAPVVISAGTFGNAGDLVVGPHHRMFLYQRAPRADLTTAELLIEARHLVDDRHVFAREGGVVEYFSLVFDRHEIVFAEGICAESLLVNDAMLQRLPEDLSLEVRARFPGLAHHQHFGTEAGRDLLDRIAAAHPARLKGARQPPIA
jgi:hypothetical protein